MKRVLDETVSSGEEIWRYTDLVWLLLESNIDMSGPLARTCHKLLKIISSTEIIQKLVEVCHREWRVIPKWLRFALPHHYFLEESDPLRFYLELDVIPILTEYIVNKPLDNQCVLTGSLVTGTVHKGAKWVDSDIDLLIKRDPDYEYTKTVIKFQRKKWDIVQMSVDIPLPYYVGHFDQSLVQMCLPENEQSLFLTSLAMYTWRTKICLITLTDDNLYYIGANQNGDKFRPGKPGSVNELFEKHRNHHLMGKKVGIHKCLACQASNFSNESFMKWSQRMKKYESRFPDYKFIYLLSEPQSQK